MRFYADERMALLVDGPNTSFAANRVEIDIDYGRLQGFFARQSRLVSSLFYTPVLEDQDGFQPVRKLVDWLDFNGWKAFTAPSPPHVELAVHAMELADDVDHFILATGNSDFVVLTEALQRRGRRVTVLSALRSGCLAEELRRVATDFLDLETLRDHIVRSRPAAKEAVTA